MILPNPIKLAITSAALGAGVTMILMGALKGACDIVQDSRDERAAEKTEEEALVEAVVDEPTKDSASAEGPEPTGETRPAEEAGPGEDSASAEKPKD